MKPNLCTHPAWDVARFATTNVRMVEAMLRLALKEERGLSVRIMESDNNDKFVDEETFRKYGYKDLEERYRESGFDVSLVSLSQPPLVKVPFEGLYFKELEVHRLLTEPRYFVSMALAKTHFTTVTGNIKNMFGLLPRKEKGFYHRGAIDFDHLIVDLARFARPDLCVIDAIVGLEGVVTGRPRRLNALIVGRKPVSLDATMARLIGLDPEKIRHLAEAEKHGLGTLDPEVLGESLESMSVEFKPLRFPSRTPKPVGKTQG